MAISVDTQSVAPIGGVAPGRVIQPETRAEAAEVIRQAASAGAALVPVGGGTQIATGWPPPTDYVALSTARLSRVADYQPDDMTLTVEPGITLAHVQRVLAERNQFLPLNPPLPERATIGGMVAAASAGPWQAGWGTPRDWVIGCRVLGADGQEVRGGGQVVKNVAGYDLPKLYTGSYGTLGLISEVTFKVMPWPGVRGFCAVTLPSTQAAETFLARVMDSDVQPAAAELALLGSDTEPVFTFEFLHVPEAIEWQMEQLSVLAAEVGGMAERLPETEGAPGLAYLRDTPAKSPFVARIATTSGSVARLISEISGLLSGQNHKLISHAWTGRVHVCLDTPNADTATGLRDLARRSGATCIFTRLPQALVGQVDPWGPVGPELKLMRGIKQTLDPTAVFSPGRFVDHI